MNKRFQGVTKGIDDQLIKETALTYLSVVFMVMVAMVFIWPRYSDIVRLKTENKKTEQRIADVEKSLAYLNAVESLVDFQAKEALFQAVPINFAPGIVLDNVRGISRVSGVSIDEYSVAGGLISDPKEASKSAKGKEITGQKNLSTAVVKWKVSGTPKALLDFLGQLEQSVPLGNITSLSISEIGKLLENDQTQGVLGMNMETGYYYFPPQSMYQAESSVKEIAAGDLEILKQIVSFRKPSSVFTNNLVGGGGNENLFEE